jgi:hypothetical protein
LHNSAHTSGVSAGKGVILLLLVFLVAVIGLAWKVTSRAAPLIQLKAPIRGLRQSVPIDFAVRDPQHHVKRVRVEVRQGGRSFAVLDRVLPTPAWWKAIPLLSRLRMKSACPRCETPNCSMSWS